MECKLLQSKKQRKNKKLNLNVKSYVNVCVCVRACVCSYMWVKMTSSICMCVGVRACVCVQRKILLTALCESFVILLVSPQSTTVFIAPGLQDAHSRSQVAQAQTELNITTDHEMPRSPRTESSRGTAMTGSKRTSSQVQSQRNATTWTWSVLPSRG